MVEVGGGGDADGAAGAVMELDAGRQERIERVAQGGVGLAAADFHDAGGAFGEAGDSGGEGVTRNKHYLGDKPGFVALNYQLFQRPDDIKVIYRGQQIAGTGGPRSGRGGFGFDWNPVAGDYSVDVIVTGEQWGTRWNYAIACPKGSRR